MDAGTIRKGIKLNAKRQFFSYMLPCIGVALLDSIITTLFSLILSGRMPDAQTLLTAEDLTVYWPQIAQIYGLTLAFSLLISPLTVGSYAFFNEVYAGKRPPFTSVFAWLGEGKKVAAAYKANLWYLLITVKYVLLFLVPASALFVGAGYLLDGSLSFAAATLYFLAFLLWAASAVAAYAYINAYAPALYMIAANPDLGTRATFQFCRQVMKKRVWEFFLFRLTFLGWELLGMITFGIGVFFVTPYVNLSTAGYTQYVKAETFRALTTEGTQT